MAESFGSEFRHPFQRIRARDSVEQDDSGMTAEQPCRRFGGCGFDLARVAFHLDRLADVVERVPFVDGADLLRDGW